MLSLLGLANIESFCLAKILAIMGFYFLNTYGDLIGRFKTLQKFFLLVVVNIFIAYLLSKHFAGLSSPMVFKLFLDALMFILNILIYGKLIQKSD